MLGLKKWVQGIDSLVLVRGLIVMEMVALLTSTAAVNAIESLIFLCFVFSKNLRQRLWSSLRQPMVIMTLAWASFVTIGVVYGITPFAEGIDILGSWRKLLLLPLVASAYDDSAWKQNLVLVLIGVSTLFALVSFAGFGFGFTILKQPSGIVVYNHATQGMFFSVALFAALVLFKFAVPSLGKFRWLLALTAAILAANVLLFTPGRSGYLAFLCLITVFSFYSVRGHVSSLWVLIIVPVLISGVMLLSPVARQRILLAVDEVQKQNYEQSKELTSMGIRMIMWRNTIHLLQRYEHPWFGYGVGSFEKAYASEVAGQKGWQGQPVGDPHNQYLRIMVEQGLVGLIVFLGFILSFFKQRTKGWSRIAGIGVLLAWCATSIFSAHFTTFHEGRFVLLWCGTLLSQNPELPYKSGS